MRLEKYVIEEIGTTSRSLVEAKEVLKRECKLYFNLLKKTNSKEPLYRGLYHTGFFVKKKVRTDREPMGMDIDHFNALNKFLKRNGHVPRNASVSVSPEYDHTVMFGVSHYFFPAGDFDFTVYVNKDHSEDINFSIGFKGMLDRYAKFEPDKDSLLKPYFKSNDMTAFRKALKLGSEIWFGCDHYYGVNVDLLIKLFGIGRADALKELGGY